ncbi:MAG: hypothetical protein IJH37_12080 [Clostridia bacterium]|nr:hypothetical protein [Clostridia bacterium]
MIIYTVSLFGHRYIDDVAAVEDKLEPIIENILKNHEYVEFLVGRNGEFDRIAASTIRRVRRRLEHEDCSLILILPYVTAEYENNEEYFHQYYDDVEICCESSNSHYKTAITVRNKCIVDRSDLIICYVTKQGGGAYNAMHYAAKCAKSIINASI